MGFNLLMCKEFSPFSCCFSYSHKLCCSGRGGALICSQILWGSVCAGWRSREHGGCVKSIPKAEQPRWGHFREGSGCSSLAGRRVLAPSDGTKLWFPRTEGWSSQIQAVTKSSAVGCLCREQKNCSDGEMLPAIVIQHPPAIAPDAVCA